MIPVATNRRGRGIFNKTGLWEEEQHQAELLLESSKRWSYVTQDKSRFGGKGVSKAVENINTIISDVLCGMDPSNIYAIDQAMIDAGWNQR